MERQAQKLDRDLPFRPVRMIPPDTGLSEGVSKVTDLARYLQTSTGRHRPANLHLHRLDFRVGIKRHVMMLARAESCHHCPFREKSRLNFLLPRVSSH